MLFLPAGRAPTRRGAAPGRGRLRGGRAAGRALARRPVRCPRARREARRLATGVRPGDRRSPARAADDPGRWPTTPSSAGCFVARRRARDRVRDAGGALARASRPVRLVPHDRLQGPRRRWPAGRRSTPTSRAAVASATRSSTSATRPTPTRPGGSPSRSARSRTTARSTRCAATASSSAAAAGDLGAQPIAARPGRAAGPLLSPRRLGLALARRGARAAGDLRLAARRRPCWPRSPRRPPCAARRTRTSRRSAAGPPGSSRRGTGPPPSSSPTAGGSARCSTATGCGRRRSRSPATGWSRSASEAGAVPFAAADTIRRGRLGPGRDVPRRPGPPRRSWRTPRPRRGALRALPIHDAPRPIHEDRPEATPRALATRRTPIERAAALLAGLDAERPRLDIKTMALEAHEPLWSMGDDTPTAGRGRLDRPVADHLRQSFAQVTNPAIDPERERIVMDLRVELGRRPALLGGLPRGRGPCASTARSWPTSTACSARSGRRRPRIADARRHVGRRRTGRPASRPPSTGSPPTPSRPPAAGVEVLVLSDHRLRRSTGCRSRRSSAAGAVHTALTEAGLRGQTDLVVDASDVLDVHAMAMALAVGATAVAPGLAIELAAELAGTRGAEDADAPRRPSATSSHAFEAGLRKVLARMGISAVASYIGGVAVRGRSSSTPESSRAASRRRRRGPAGRPSTDLRRAAAPPRGRPRPSRRPRRPRAAPAGSRASPASAPMASPTSSRRPIAKEIQALGSRRLERPRRRRRCRARALPRGARPGRGAVRAARPAARPPRAGARPARRGRGRPLDRAPVRRSRR